MRDESDWMLTKARSRADVARVGPGINSARSKECLWGYPTPSCGRFVVGLPFQ